MAIEADATRARRLRGRLRFARYPIHKTLAEFDLDFQPSLDRKVLAELSTLRFVEERPQRHPARAPGVGKSHLPSHSASPPLRPAIATYFTSAADLVANLQSAHLEGTASYKMRTYTGPRCWWSTKLGYLPLDQASANWIFQMVSRRYEKASIVLTSNRGFGDWNRSSLIPWSHQPSSTDSCTTPPSSHQGPQLSHASLRRCPAGQGRECYGRVTLSCALFVLNSVHSSSSLTRHSRPCHVTMC